MSFETAPINQPNALAEKSESDAVPAWKSNQTLKTVSLYATMVIVSTVAIYLLEHASLVNAIRTALVAAVGKTAASLWVSGFFE